MKNLRKATAALLLVLLTVAGLALGYGVMSPGRQSTTSVSSQQTHASTLSFETPTVSTISSSGLELRIHLNATRIQAGHTLAANVTLFNTHDKNLSLFPSQSDFDNSMVQSWDNYDFPCGESGYASYLVSFALFRGYFSAVNISRATVPLTVTTSWPQLCNSLLGPDKVVFLPNSSFAFMYLGTYLEDKTSVKLSPGLLGYWNVTSQTCCAGHSASNFRYFSPGEYTFAAADIWNQTAYAYFRLTQGPSPSLAVSAQESPFSNPNSPVIGITLANFGGTSITSLDAVLRFGPSPNGLAGSSTYSFVFGANSSDPLLPGQTVQDVRTFQGSLLDIGVNYPLTISGRLANGTTFTYTQQIQLVNSVPSP